VLTLARTEAAFTAQSNSRAYRGQQQNVTLAAAQLFLATNGSLVRSIEGCQFAGRRHKRAGPKPHLV